MEIEAIARFRSPFTSKFGVPKQSGMVEELEGQIVFEPSYRNPSFLHGIEGFDFLWLIWGFSANVKARKTSTVRPPLLGGNVRMGVFATRSPFRPNNMGLSSVRLSHIDYDTPDGPVITVLGADLMDGTPIYDIKPYIRFSDCHQDARCGFVDKTPVRCLDVIIPDDTASLLTPQELTVLKKTLTYDPRPHYHDDPDKTYGMPFGRYDVKFRVNGDTLTVVALESRATSAY